PDLYRRLLLQPRGSAHPLVTAPSTTALAPLSLHDALPIFASTTENPYFYIYNALLSRCTVFEFKSLTAQDVEQGVRSAVARLSAEGDAPVTITDEAAQYLAESAGGDMRKALGSLEFAVAAAEPGPEGRAVTLDMIRQVTRRTAMRYDKD